MLPRDQVLGDNVLLVFFLSSFIPLIQKKYFKNTRLRQQDIDILKDITSTDKLTEIDTNKFWDFSRNADLDGFSSSRIYRSLFDQSVNMASDIGGQTDNAKEHVLIKALAIKRLIKTGSSVR